MPAKGYDKRKQKICLSSSVDAPRRLAPYSNAAIIWSGLAVHHEVIWQGLIHTNVDIGQHVCEGELPATLCW
jgi:hypothetical protein